MTCPLFGSTWTTATPLPVKCCDRAAEGYSGRGATIASVEGSSRANATEAKLAALAKTTSLPITATDQERVIASSCNYINVCDQASLLSPGQSNRDALTPDNRIIDCIVCSEAAGT